jgi:hypothetical protein
VALVDLSAFVFFVSFCSKVFKGKTTKATKDERINQSTKYTQLLAISHKPSRGGEADYFLFAFAEER